MGEGSGIAGAIASFVLLGVLLLPGVLVLLLFVFFTVMGMIEGTDFRASTLNVPVLLTGVAVVTTALVVAILAGAGLIGRSLTPRKRRRRGGGG
jgi:hypothetical protein